MNVYPIEPPKFLFPTARFEKHPHQPSVSLLRWFNGDVKELHINTKLVAFSHTDLSHKYVIHDSNPL